jgi:hypothetical protein
MASENECACGARCISWEHHDHVWHHIFDAVNWARDYCDGSHEALEKLATLVTATVKEDLHANQS